MNEYKVHQLGRTDTDAVTELRKSIASLSGIRQFSESDRRLVMALAGKYSTGTCFSSARRFQMRHRDIFSAFLPNQYFPRILRSSTRVASPIPGLISR